MSFIAGVTICDGLMLIHKNRHEEGSRVIFRQAKGTTTSSLFPLGSSLLLCLMLVIFDDWQSQHISMYLDAGSMCRFADRLVQTEETPPRLSSTCVQGTQETNFRPLVKPYPSFFLAPSTGSLGSLSPPRSSLLALVPIPSFLVSRRTRARGHGGGSEVPHGCKNNLRSMW